MLSDTEEESPRRGGYRTKHGSQSIFHFKMNIQVAEKTSLQNLVSLQRDMQLCQ